MITFEFEDIEGILYQLRHPKKTNLEKMASQIEEGEEWKQREYSPQPWYVNFGETILPGPLSGSISIDLLSNGRVYSGYVQGPFGLQIPESLRKRDYVGDEKTGILICEGNAMYSIKAGNTNLKIRFGVDGTRRRPLPSEVTDSFRDDLLRFTKIIEVIINNGYEKETNVRYFLNSQ